MPDENGRVSLREFIEQRFDALDDRLDQLDDHESRLRALEKRDPWRTVIEAITAMIAVVATALGLNK